MRTLFVFARSPSDSGLRCLGGGTGPGVILWRSRTDRGASQPADGIVGRVVNLDNGRSVIVRIADRRPFIHGRIIDVSTEVAVTLGFREAGLADVRIERMSAETLEASAGPSRPAAPASDQTSSLLICRYRADRVEHLATRPGRRPSAAAVGRRTGTRDFPIGASDWPRARTIWRPLSPPLANPVQRRAGEGREHPRAAWRIGGYGGGREHLRGALAEASQTQSPRTCSASHCAAASAKPGAAAGFEHRVFALRGTLPGFD